MENKLAALIYPAHRFWENSIDEALKLAALGVGGFCLYGGKAEEIKELVFKTRQINPDLLFCADYENGAGQWVNEGSILPSNLAIGASGDFNMARKKAVITAKEAAALGVNWLLAPVCDLADTPGNPIVNTRAFSGDKKIASAMVKAYLLGVKEESLLSSLKHFPGHGATCSDSHLELPFIDKSLEELLGHELVPFMDNLKDADSVMTGHFKINALDGNYPTSYSCKAVNRLLKERLGFKGLVVSDALSMKAVADETQAGPLALNAGVDILLVPDNPYALLKSLMQAYERGIIADAIVARALEMQNSLKAKTDLKNNFNLEILGVKEHLAFNEEVAAKACCFVKGKETRALKSGDEIDLIVFGKTAAENIETLKQHLQNAGIRTNAGAAQKLIFSYHAPKAMSGHIKLTDEEKRFLFSCGNESVIMAALGSPFVFCGVMHKIKTGLCTFDNNKYFQKAALDILLGARQALGKMPVEIK